MDMFSQNIATILNQLQHDFDEKATANNQAHKGKVPKRKKASRSKDEIRRRQEELYEKTLKEINELLDAYYAVLSRKDAESVGALYARYSSRFQDSIIDQIRTILEEAIRKKVFIPRENVFFDLAIRGWKDRRPGLLALRKKIEAAEIQTFMVFTTSRLYRRTYKALQFVEEELVERNIRGIFVKSNIDTVQGDHWRTIFQALAANDEAQVRIYSSHIQASHEGLFARQMVHTSLSLGYTGEVVEGEFTRRQLPRRKIVIDPDTARWIVQIFYWYVVDGISIAAIARKLNADEDAPAPAKSNTGLWTHKLVRTHIENTEYRGWWQYGAKETKWLSKKDYAHQIPRDKPLKEGQFEELRIIPDDCWYTAQEMIANEAGNSGRKPKDSTSKPCPRLLRGLFVCPEHGRKLAVGGAKACVMLCPNCRFIEVHERPLFTHLNRELALKLTCEHLTDCVRPTDDFVDTILNVLEDYVGLLSQPEPAIVESLQSRADALASTIEFNRRNPGVSEQEQRKTEQLLKELRSEQNEVFAQLRSTESALAVSLQTPSREQIIAFLTATSDLLSQSMTSTDEIVVRNGRRVIESIVKGKIELYQMGERAKSKGWLQGRFLVDVPAYVLQQLTGVRISESSTTNEVVIDYKKSKLINEQSETAKRLWDDGLLHVEIAKQMGCIPSYVTKLIQHWHDQRGLPQPNNKKRRKLLINKQQRTPIYKQIAIQVHELMEAGHSNLEIARQTKTSDTNVAKAIRWWHEKRELSVPTAADRRKQKIERALAMLDGGALLTNVATELGYSARGLKLALDKFAKDKGGEKTDFRSRRGNAKSGASANGKDSPSDSDTV